MPWRIECHGSASGVCDAGATRWGGPGGIVPGIWCQSSNRVFMAGEISRSGEYLGPGGTLEAAFIHTPRRTESAVEGAVLQLRDEKGWGARKLAKMLSLRGIKVAPATAHRILKRAGRVVEPAVDKSTTRFERAECNELAQMDFKGEYTLPSQQKCYPLSFLMTAAAICMGCGP